MFPRSLLSLWICLVVLLRLLGTLCVLSVRWLQRSRVKSWLEAHMSGRLGSLLCSTDSYGRRMKNLVSSWYCHFNFLLSLTKIWDLGFRCSRKWSGKSRFLYMGLEYHFYACSQHFHRCFLTVLIKLENLLLSHFKQSPTAAHKFWFKNKKTIQNYYCY